MKQIAIGEGYKHGGEEMSLTKTGGKIFVRKSSYSDSVCDIVLMDTETHTAFKASFNREKTRKIRDLLTRLLEAKGTANV